MALFLINEAESGSLTLKYGLGNRLMMQLAAGEQKKLPREFSTKLLQSYLAVFKDLRVIEEGKAEKVEEKLENNELGVNDEELDSDGKDPATNNDAKPNEDQGDDTNGDESENIPDDNQDNGSNEDQGDESAGQDDNAGDDTKDDESSNESDKPQLKPENEIKKMNAEELKQYAKELGLDFEEDITKKALLAVILSKQDEE